MTILDTFYLLFKTDASGAKNDVTALDQQLDLMEKKGNKRSVEENKRYAELKKQRKELLDATKQQQRENDKLNESFTRMIESAVGAVTAYTTFGALKAGLIDANKLNASLAILGKTTGQNAGEVKAYGAALESVGGKAEDLYGFIQSQALFAAAHRTPFEATGFLERLHNQVKNKSPQEALTLLQQIPGAVSLAPLLELPDNEFHAAIAGGRDRARLSEADEKAALENQTAFAKTKQAFSSIATEIDTKLLGTIKSLNDALQGLASTLSGHPNVALGAGVGAATATAVGGGIIAGKLWSGIRALFGLGGAAATAEGLGAAGLGTAGLGIAGSAAAGTALTFGAGAVGDWIGRKIRGDAPGGAGASNKQQILDFWKSQGYGPGAAAGWTANAQAESSFNPSARNGSHGGIYQWSQTRRKKILDATGIDVWNASLADQLKAAAWEANGMGLSPGAVPDNAGTSAALISNKFDVPATTASGLAMEAARRAQIAQSYGNIPSVSGISQAAAGKSVNIKIDDVNIHTQASDAGGIAREVGIELKNQIRMAMSNFDDGIGA